MNFIAVDDEKLALDNLVAKLKKAKSKAVIKGFSHPETALQEIKKGFLPDVAFLDIEMYGMNGIELARRFKEVMPKVNIIFVTGFSQYASDAFKLHASGYLNKPVRVEQILKELDNLRYPIYRNEHRIRVQTFESFQVFVDGKMVQFGRRRTKELLACLVDRCGSGLTMAQIASVLWEDRKYDRSLQNQLQVHVSDLIRTLKAVDAMEMIFKKHNCMGVVTENFDCDYYHFLDGDVAAINAYHGEYMNEYSWAEFTAGCLMQNK